MAASMEERVPDRKRGSGLKIAFIVLVILALVGVFWYRRLDRISITKASEEDVQKILGSDLAWKRPEPAANRLAQADLVKLARDEDAMQVTFRFASIEQKASFITGSWKVTETLDRMIEGKVLQDEVTEFDDMSSSGAQRLMARVISSQIELELLHKNGPRAFDAARRALRYAAFLRRSPVGSEVHLMSQGSAIELAMGAAEKVVLSGLLSAEQLAALFPLIERAPVADEQLANAMRGVFEKETVPELVGLAEDGEINAVCSMVWKATTPVDGFVVGELDIPATLREAAAMKRTALANCSRPWTERDQSVAAKIAGMKKEIPALPTADKPGLSQVIEFKSAMQSIPNVLGKMALSRLPFGDEHSLGGSFRRRTQIEGHRLVILFEMYKKAHANALPASLDELKPLCKGDFPRDVYSGKPFVYERDKHTFWSVGKDAEPAAPGSAPGTVTVPVVWTIR